jgi:hypothetical protein
MNIKDKLNNLTGLQRAFLVAFLVCWGYFAIWGSLTKADEADSGNRQFSWAVERDFANPNCLPYTTKPLSELPEPKWENYGGTCWHIFTHRKYGESEIKLPFTKEAYERSRTLEFFGILSMFFAINTALVVIAFALFFGAYRIGRWIFAGFKKP